MSCHLFATKLGYRLRWIRTLSHTKCGGVMQAGVEQWPLPQQPFSEATTALIQHLLHFKTALQAAAWTKVSTKDAVTANGRLHS